LAKADIITLGLHVHGATSTFSFIGELAPSASLTIQSDFFADADRKLLTGIGVGLSSTDSLILSGRYNELFVRLTLKEVGPLSGSVEVQTTFAQAPVAISVPESASLILFGSGLAALAVWRRKHTS
jgi:hypothetical protein